MREENEKITLAGEKALSIFRELEYILISLRNIGRYYHNNTQTDNTNPDYCKETTRFIDAKNITHRLAEMRAILAAKFETTIGEDDMDDLERAVGNIKVWEMPGD